MSETVIVIDDDEMINESLSELLEIMEIDVIGNGFDGKQAVDLFARHDPVYSLIDLNMPNFDGFFAIENILKINPNALVFAVTGDVSVNTREKLEKLGATGIIYKPFKISDMIDTLRAARSSQKVGYAA